MQGARFVQEAGYAHTGGLFNDVFGQVAGAQDDGNVRPGLSNALGKLNS